MGRTVAVVFGAIYVLAGLAGFVLASPIFGLFEVNVLHNVVHLLIGAILLAVGFMGETAEARTTA